MLVINYNVNYSEKTYEYRTHSSNKINGVAIYKGLEYDLF